MRTTLTDLNNYLFEQIERISDDELTDEQFERELKKSKALQVIAKTIIESGQLALDAKKHMDEMGGGQTIELTMLGVKDKP